MRFILKLILSLGVLAFPLFSMAEEVSLTLESAMAMAQARNPKLQAEKLELDISDADIRTAGNRPQPELMFDVAPAENTYRVVGFIQTFETGSKRRKRIAIASAEKQTAIAAYNGKRLKLRGELREAYARAYALDQKQRLFNRPVSGTDKSIEALKKENDIDRQTLEARQARIQLNHLLALPLDTTLMLARPEDELFDEQSEDLLSKALSDRPDLQENLHQQQAAKGEEILERAKRSPDVEFSVGPDLTTDPDRWGVFVMGRMPLPIYDNQKGAINKAKARQQQLALELADLQSRAQLDAREAWEAYLHSRKTLQRYEQNILPVAAQNKDAQAHQAYIELQLEALDVLIEHQKNIARLEQAIGLLD